MWLVTAGDAVCVAVEASLEVNHADMDVQNVRAGLARYAAVKRNQWFLIRFVIVQPEQAGTRGAL